MQTSAEAVPEKKKRKRKGHSEASDLDAGTKQEGDQQAIDKYDEIPTSFKDAFYAYEHVFEQLFLKI